MRHRVPPSMKALFAAPLVALLVSCGGGGGGGGSPPAPVPLSLINATPARFDANINVDDPVPSLTISARIAGDLNQLAGRQVFVIVEDPQGLFAPTATLVVSGNTGQVALTGVVKTTPATLTGNLRVFVCLDAGCNSQFTGSPLVVPYSVVVHPPLSIAPTATMTAEFGSMPAVVDLPVTLPFGASTFIVRQMRATAFFTATPVTSPTPALRVSADVAQLGTHTAEIEIEATTVAANVQRSMTRQLTVTYTVTPSNTVQVVFSPPAVNLTIPFNDPLVRFQSVLWLAQTGSLDFTGFDFSGSVPPGGADPLAPYASWLFFSGQLNISHCVLIIPTTHCMAPGVYVARMRFRHTDGMVITDYNVPFTLTVSP